MPPCCGQVFPLKKTVAEMTALQAASGFIPGQMYQITDAYQAATGNSVTLTDCGTNIVVVLPITLTGNTSGATASWTAGDGTPATLGSQTGLFKEGETVTASNGNCYVITDVTMKFGAVLNIRAFSKNRLEDYGFGSFINTNMTDPVYARLWYILDDQSLLATDIIYRVQDAPSNNDILEVPFNDLSPLNASIDFFNDEGANNVDRSTIMARTANVSATTTGLRTIVQKTAYGVDLSTYTPTHFVLKYVSGTFAAVTVRFLVNGVVLYVGSNVGAPVNTTPLADLNSTNDIIIPIIATSKMSLNPAHLIEVEVMVANAGGAVFTVDVIGVRKAG